ncbi:hypothetical protein VOLCADRAFT_95785 [Volvox carteri f. nagariensis]|uniref:Uncharacterized protein n=1 Tax=Volvox carteri f. nagariensis TaxID=3068 RepID=D8U8D6_VOLCA|nr:uncharacterized protein VOLCADRAFT_95785 [Volvox carteri f. nagariensis]EFJ43909.1 hypothetical protein VOLCADRAFT_95785 [Volvox carteri f. nagariensis]|eukprot:XP_002954921.1 hypothetical protein VOLCADRAFT_95785 [Volvox carteri f. nagariensis]
MPAGQPVDLSLFLSLCRMDGSPWPSCTIASRIRARTQRTKSTFRPRNNNAQRPNPKQTPKPRYYSYYSILVAMRAREAIKTITLAQPLPLMTFSAPHNPNTTTTTTTTKKSNHICVHAAGITTSTI